MTIRACNESLAFALPEVEDRTRISFYRYISKSGISIAANLREAFKTVEMLREPIGRATLLVDTPVLLIPLDEYKEGDKEVLYKHSFPSTEGSTIVANALPDLNAVALFALNRDLKTVIDDHCEEVRYVHLMQPVWDYLHRRSFLGNRRKLYVYFHDNNQLEIFSFERNHFIFYNRYEARSIKDMVYFILFVWKQLALDQMRDELFLVGDIPEKDNLLKALRIYVQMVAVINAAASFNNVPLTQEKGITFDMITALLA
jgi:hypothetical protein